MDLVEFSDILELFKDDFNNDEYTLEYDQLEVGDIIFAKRYTNEEEMLEIPDGHRNGPYVVIGKEQNEFICLYVSGTPSKYDPYYNLTLILDNINYNLSKTSYVYLTKYAYISKDKFIKKIGFLNEMDTKTLFRKLDVINRKGLLDDININIPNVPLEIGDVFYDNDLLYLIISENDKSYQCINLLDKKCMNCYFVYLDNIRYYFNFDNIINYSKILEPIRYNFLDNKTLHNVLVKYREHLNLLKKKLEIHRGSLVSIKNKYYYVYGEISILWMAFEVVNKINQNLCSIIIGRKRYYTNFSNLIEFSKNDNDINIIDFASELEIDNIKDKKKSYNKKIQDDKKKKIISDEKKKNISDEKKIINSRMQPGSLVKLVKCDNGYRHLVIARNNSELVTIRYDKYLSGEYLYGSFFAEQMELCGHIYNFDLMEILLDIRDRVVSKGAKKKIIKVINELNEMNEIDSNFPQDKDTFGIVRKLIPPK